MKKHRQYFSTESEPTEYVSIVASSPVAVNLPAGYVSVSAKSYRRLKWLARKLRILDRADRLKEKASKIKKALSED